MSNEPIASNRILIAHKGSVVVAYFRTFPCGVAEGHACYVSVGVGVGPNEVKDKSNPGAVLRAKVSEFRAAGSGVADEQFNNKGGNFKEGVYE